MRMQNALYTVNDPWNVQIQHLGSTLQPRRSSMSANALLGPSRGVRLSVRLVLVVAGDEVGADVADLLVALAVPEPDQYYLAMLLEGTKSVLEGIEHQHGHLGFVSVAL